MLLAAAVEVVSINLLHDTVCRRARSAVVNAVHSADEFVSRLSRSERRVLFEAASPLSLAVFRPVLEYAQRYYALRENMRYHADFFLARLHGTGMLNKRTSRQWYDPQLSRFLPDRLVRGTCI